jgi:hypothetical protein
MILDFPDESSERWHTLREHLASARGRRLKLRPRQGLIPPRQKMPWF